jgi:hypothetical protein
MSLMECPDCGRQVSDLADRCIGCGRPLEKPPVWAGPPLECKVTWQLNSSAYREKYREKLLGHKLEPPRWQRMLGRKQEHMRPEFWVLLTLLEPAKSDPTIHVQWPPGSQPSFEVDSEVHDEVWTRPELGEAFAAQQKALVADGWKPIAFDEAGRASRYRRERRSGDSRELWDREQAEQARRDAEHRARMAAMRKDLADSFYRPKLISCSDCGRSISSVAAVCPGCGRRGG